jgi:uncharacterized protein (TIGR03435 family)
MSTGPLRAVIAMAYDLPREPSSLQLRDMPDWLMPPSMGLLPSGGLARFESRDDGYTIEATGVFPPGLSRKARDERERAMLQSLLADRFKLKIHSEKGEMPVEVLEVAEGGPKLQKADIEEKDCPAPDPLFPAPGDTNLCHNFVLTPGRLLLGRAVDMPDLLRWLQDSTSFPLVDKTGIKGLYRIETTAGFNLSQPEAAQQLGLKFELQNDKVDVQVIDHIEKPTLN